MTCGRGAVSTESELSSCLIIFLFLCIFNSGQQPEDCIFKRMFHSVNLMLL